MTIFHFPIYVYSRDVSYGNHNAIRVGLILTAYLVLNFMFMFIYQEYKNTCKYFKRHTKTLQSERENTRKEKKQDYMDSDEIYSHLKCTEDSNMK